MKLFKYIFLLLLAGSAGAQTDTLHLETVTVTAGIVRNELKNTARNVTVIDRRMIEASPVKTLDGVLQYALNVDVRSRSAFGVQADISIRGGHYDQTLILVDGVKVNDPQTGHHSLNIPIPFSMIEKIEVLQGGASRVFGPSAFSGVINIITRTPASSELEVGLSAGEYGTWNTSLGGAWVKSGFSLTGGADLGGSDGFMPATGYRKNTASLQAQKQYRGGSLLLGYGFTQNDFGASNFYHPKYYNQYEEVSSQLLNAAWKHAFSDRLSGTLMANYRLHHDMFDFDNYRNTDRLNFLNLHKTGVIDLEWKFRLRHAHGSSAFGAEYRNEAVRSNRLGEALHEAEDIPGWPNLFYTHGKRRDNYSLFVEHSTSWNRFILNAGSLANINSEFGFSLFPGLDLAYTLGRDARLYYSVNRSLRFPTFTELYLNNATVAGDPNLLPEKAWTQEIGFKTQKSRYSAQYSAFYTATEDAIDKIKRPSSDVPLMENIDDIHRYGLETAHTLALPANRIGITRISLNYAWISANRKEDGFQSFYTLNYLKHKLSAGLFFEPVKNLSLSGWYTWKSRAGQYAWDNATPPVDYGSFSLVDVRLAYGFKAITFTLDANNLFNTKYFEHGFVVQPPRWITAGVRLRL